MTADRTAAISRRVLLRGAGVAMALPWLESLAVWGSARADETSGAAATSPDGTPGPLAVPGADDASPIPKRLAVMFMANGINPGHWWARGAGADMELGKCLEPLEPFKAKLNFITGLFNRAAVGVGIHPGQTGNLLSGAQLQKGAELRGGISMDQLLANQLGQATMQPSLVLGCEQPVTGYHETNFSMAYGSHISWQSATSPVPMETYPSLAFDSLFENRGTLRNRSILDRVAEHAASLSRQVSSADQAKLDEYLTSVREVETRIDRMRVAADKAAERARHQGQSLFTIERPANGLPEDIREHMRLMCDIAAMAFQTDKTRIATILLCRDISGLFYPFLDVRAAHHPASHSDHSDDYAKIVRYYCEQVAYLAQKLAAMPEGPSTVLDNSLVMFMSNMWSGSQHDSTKVPVVQIGGLGGSLQTGRVLDYTKAGDDHRKLCSMYLGIMDRMGVELPRFGDADTRLENY